MKTVLISGLMALGLATGASAGGLTYSGGQVTAGVDLFFDTSGGDVYTSYSVSGAVAFDFTGSDYELQIDASLPALGVSSDVYDVSLTVGKQTNANTKVGAFVGAIGVGSDAVAQFGLVGMTQVSSGAYVDGTLNVLVEGGEWVGVASARYTTGNWFGDAAVIFSGNGGSVFGTLQGGYEMTIADTAVLSASVGALIAEGDFIPVANLDLTIPFGGVRGAGDIDSRLFRHTGYFDVVPGI